MKKHGCSSSVIIIISIIAIIDSAVLLCAG